MFVKRLPIPTNGCVVENGGFVFKTGCCRGEEIIAVECTHETVYRSVTGEVRENFMVSTLKIES
jgi:hypothetical protein